MTENTETGFEMTPALERFVLHWGDMGRDLGRQTLRRADPRALFVAGRAMNAEEIAETLKIARSNVSTSIRRSDELGIGSLHAAARRPPRLLRGGCDVWEMASKIVAIRKARRSIRRRRC
ncbi:MAG: hypothetical protein R3C42_05400 [Parvularculaceae bacterium]